MVEFLQQNVYLVILAVSSGGMLLWTSLRGGGNGISPAAATLKINRENALVIDVRESAEWSAGHIPEARHFALGQLEKRLHEIDKHKDRPLIVCCASGGRSSAAVATLKKAGFAQVFNLAGGMAAWAEASLPVTRK
ncbi:MAG: rhodanese-like domain-containing protein [Rhodocyclaceae bacterium]|nr:rhodanese-like domain-containing protein [Rhodocyclaceae bacterium]